MRRSNILETPNRIKEWRNRRRMSLAELGEVVGLSRSEISKLENGSRRVRSDHLIALSKALRVRPEDLLSVNEARELLSHNEELNEERSKPRHAVGIDLPVCGTSSEQGFCVDEESPQAFVHRPPQLDQVAGAYAVHMPTTNLEPHVKVGALMYINPVLPARADDLAVVRYNNSKRVDIVHVTRNAEGQLTGQQYGKEKTSINLESGDVKTVQRVVGCWFS